MEPSKLPKLSVYDWKSDEWLLVDWYSHMVRSGDMYVTFTPDMRYMGNFLSYFRPPRTLGYAADAKGLFFAFWLEPFLSGAFAGLWIRADKRQSLTALKLTIAAYNAAFQFATVLIGISKQEHLTQIHKKIGYTHRISIPGLWNGDAVDVYTMTKADWERRNGGREK